MSDAELLTEIKKGMNMPVTGTEFDDTLNQKLRIVKTFLTGAGVSAETMASDSVVGAIVVGATDLWNLSPGEIKFSPAFFLLANQLR